MAEFPAPSTSSWGFSTATLLPNSSASSATKEAAAEIALLSKKGLPYISVLTDPTMGGISASFAFMGDVVMAEPKALIGFAGPRVIEQTVREKLPEGFQRSEFLMQKGGIDMIVDRRQMRREIAHLLALLQRLPEPALASSAAV